MLPAAESRHALRVLRLEVGSSVQLLDGDGCAATAEVRMVQRVRRSDQVTCCISERRVHARPAARVRLLVAPPRRRLLERIVADATQLGVSRITALLCERSVWRPSSGRDMWQRCRQEAIVAMKQSGNVFLPRFDAPCLFAAAVAETGAGGYFGAIPAAGCEPPRIAVPVGGELNLWVGPEGGFTDGEVEQLRAGGCVPVPIGAWTLRVETAVPALLGFALGTVGHDNVRCQHR